MYKCVLLIGAEIHSTGLDLTPEGRDVSVLFGDGGGAVVIEPSGRSTKPEGILSTKLYGEGQFAEKLWIHRPSSSDFPRLTKGPGHIDPSFFPQMEGKFVFKHAVTRMCEVLTETCASVGVQPHEIDFVLAHQANMRINMMIMEQLKIPFDRTLNTIQKYGNTTAATIPIGLQEAKTAGLLKKDHLVALVAFGSSTCFYRAFNLWQFFSRHRRPLAFLLPRT
jgi:3-oxoacyl-[acyl-carrier-protein] synthase-3